MALWWSALVKLPYYVPLLPHKLRSRDKTFSRWQWIIRKRRLLLAKSRVGFSSAKVARRKMKRWFAGWLTARSARYSPNHSNARHRLSVPFWRMIWKITRISPRCLVHRQRWHCLVCRSLGPLPPPVLAGSMTLMCWTQRSTRWTKPRLIWLWLAPTRVFWWLSQKPRNCPRKLCLGRWILVMMRSSR